jgi:hypothetical protein
MLSSSKGVCTMGFNFFRLFISINRKQKKTGEQNEKNNKRKHNSFLQ